MVKKHLIALFLNTAQAGASVPVWKRIKKSTELTISMNGETVDYDYIADESPTTELAKYKPSINQPLTMYKGEPDFDFVFSRFYGLSVGSNAHCDVMVVYMFEGNKEIGYKAWKSDSILNITEMNAVDSTITFDIMFGGTVARGKAMIVDGNPVFTEMTADEIEAEFGSSGKEPAPDTPDNNGTGSTGGGESGGEPEEQSFNELYS